MFTLYTVLLTLHILLVAGWLGAGVSLHAVARLSADEPQTGAILNKFAEPWFPAVSGLTGLTGIFLWIDGPWDLGEIWVLIALVGWLVSSFTGATRLGPSVKAWGEGDLAARDRFFAIAPYDLGLIVLIVCDMVLKPGL